MPFIDQASKIRLSKDMTVITEIAEMAY